MFDIAMELKTKQNTETTFQQQREIRNAQVYVYEDSMDMKDKLCLGLQGNYGSCHW